MRPTYDEGRGRARCTALLTRARLNKDRACFIGVLLYAQKEASSTGVVECDSALIDCDSPVISSATVRTSSSSISQQVAIALELTNSFHDTIQIPRLLSRPFRWS